MIWTEFVTYYAVNGTYASKNRLECLKPTTELMRVDSTQYITNTERDRLHSK